MKKLFYAVLTLAIVILPSCSNDDNSITENTDNVAANFTSKIDKDGTKVSGAAWSANDFIGIFMKPAGVEFGLSAIAPQTYPFKYVTANGDGIFAPVKPEETYYLPKDGNVDFVAYYPASMQGYADKANDDYVVAVLSGGQEERNFMLATNATNVSSATPTVNLNFKYKMSNLVFNITLGSGLTKENFSELSVSIWYIYLNTVYSFKQEKFLQLGDKRDDTGCMARISESGLSAECSIIPQTITAEKYDSRVIFSALEKDADGKFVNVSWTWNLPVGTVYEEGKRYIYNVTLTKSSLSVNSQITDWVSETPIDVVVK